jgi:trigger factor
MKVNVEQVGPCRKVLVIEIPADAVAAEHRKVAAEFVRFAKIPGFRPGHAPQAIVERNYSRDIIEELRERLVPQAYRSAVEQEKIRPVAVVNVSDVHLTKDLPLTFRVAVDVEPDFTLPSYKGIALKTKAPQVTDADVDQVIAGLRERHARFDEVTGRRANKGDIVQVDYAGVCEGRPVGEHAEGHEELSQGRDFWVLLGTPEFLPGLADGLEGVAVGEHRDITVTFPEGHAVPALVGKQAVYAVDVKAIRERKLPELDAEFCRVAGVESVDALRSRVRADLIEAAEGAEKNRLKDEIIKWLVANVDMRELPQTLVDEEARHIIQNVVQENVMRGVAREQIEAHREDIFSKAAESSTDRVRIDYILNRIAENEKIDVTEAEVDQEVERMATRNNVPRERLLAALEKRDGVAGLRHQLRMVKTLDFLLASAAVEAA